MKIKIYPAFLLLTVLLLFSCAGQRKAFIPVPDFSVYDTDKKIDIDNIIQTKDGVPASRMPEWLLTYVNGGNRAVEQLNPYRDKYVFIEMSESENFIALNKWAENFSTTQDFAVLAAVRIEERMISTASLFPDDEYGAFFETMVKIAYSTAYRNAVKEEIYWFKKGTVPEVYNFFILISIDRITMQSIIRNMISQAITAASPSGSQATSVNRLRNNFFEGF